MGIIKTPSTDTGQVAVTMVFALAFGIVAVFAGLWDHGTVWRGLLWAGAWSSVGWFLGFLFGIPRYLSTDTARTPGAPALESARKKLVEAEAAAKKARDDAQAAKSAGDSTKAEKAEEEATAAEKAVEGAKDEVANASAKAKVTTGPSLTVNTNLEQISDWLTKIIVGVSLVESQTLLLKMQGAATYMARSMVNVDGMGPMGLPAPDLTLASGAASAATSAAASAAAMASSVATNASGVSAVAARSVSSFYSTESFAYAVMLYFLVTGLLGSYLLTRLFLQRALDEAAASRDPAAK
jgi:hypothetical protein